MIERGLNFTLHTTMGPINVLGEVTGGGTFDDIFDRSEATEAFGVQFRVIELPMLIQLKRAAGRPKDFEAIAELEIILAKLLERGA